MGEKRLPLGKGMRVKPESGEVVLDADAIYEPGRRCVWGIGGPTECHEQAVGTSPFCGPHDEEARWHWKADREGWGIAI